MCGIIGYCSHNKYELKDALNCVSTYNTKDTITPVSRTSTESLKHY